LTDLGNLPKSNRKQVPAHVFDGSREKSFNLAFIHRRIAILPSTLFPTIDRNNHHVLSSDVMACRRLGHIAPVSPANLVMLVV
jgi:hypothetical protein